jgi:UrcA family protein
MKAPKRTGLCRALLFAIAVLAGADMNPGNVVWASDPGGVPTSRKVQLSDMDLSTPERVAELYRRIRNAARSVCGYADSRFREEQAAWDDCVQGAIAHAVAQVGSASLTDYSLARANHSRATPATESPKVVNRVR